jgi:exonuclease VII small subunit
MPFTLRAYGGEKMNNEEQILKLLETLVTKVGGLEQGQAKLEQGQAKLEKSQAKLEQGQAKLEQSQAKLEAELKKTKEHVIKIEIEHGKKLGAIGDGYDMIYKILTNEIRPDIARLTERDERRDMRLMRLEAERKSS